MMEFIRNWLLGVTGAAFLVALAECMMPKGSAKKIGCLTGSLILFLAIVRPVLSLDLHNLANWIATYRSEFEQYEQELEQENQNLLEEIIAEQSAAYIVEKAADMGITCQAEVSCREGADGLQIPSQVIITGQLDTDDINQIARMIERDFAIPREDQIYQEENNS